MKKLLIISVLSLMTSLAWAQNLKLDFDSMKMSDDKGKTWSKSAPIKGHFDIQGDKKTMTIVMMGDEQVFTINKTHEIKDKIAFNCSNTKNDNVEFTYTKKDNEILFSTSSGIISFNVIDDSKK